jgi:hypothetical protein
MLPYIHDFPIEPTEDSFISLETEKRISHRGRFEYNAHDNEEHFRRSLIVSSNTQLSRSEIPLDSKLESLSACRDRRRQKTKRYITTSITLSLERNAHKGKI